VLQDAGFLLREDDYLSGPFCEALEHVGYGSFCRVLRVSGLPASFPLIGTYAEGVKLAGSTRRLWASLPTPSRALAPLI
jgi:hypothetical protein